MSRSKTKRRGNHSPAGEHWEGTKHPPEEKPRKKNRKMDRGFQHKNTKYVFEDEFIFIAYEFMRTGKTEKALRERLGVKSSKTLYYWKEDYPLFGMAIELGRKFHKESTDSSTEFAKFLYDRMPPRMQRYWDVLMQAPNPDLIALDIEEGPEQGKKRNEQMEQEHKRIKQQLFIHAFMTMNFNFTRACRATGLNYWTARSWAENDEEFRKMLEETHQAKKDFYEESLIDLVAQRDVAATIFANKTLNADRGYSVEKNLRIKDERTSPRIEAGGIDFNQLDLPISVRKQVLEAVRKLKEQKRLEHHENGEVIDAEFEEVA